jgi:hypothetical protein
MSEVNFQLDVPDVDSSGTPLPSPFLSYDSLLSITAPDQSADAGSPSPMSGTATLSNTPSFFLPGTDSESYGMDSSSTPEPLTFVLVGLRAIIIARRFSPRVTRFQAHLRGLPTMTIGRYSPGAGIGRERNLVSRIENSRFFWRRAPTRLHPPRQPNGGSPLCRSVP